MASLYRGRVNAFEICLDIFSLSHEAFFVLLLHPLLDRLLWLK